MLIYFILGILGPLSLTVADLYCTKRNFWELFKLNLGLDSIESFNFIWLLFCWTLWPLAILIAIVQPLLNDVESSSDKYYQDIKYGQLYFDFMEEDPEFQRMKRRILKCK